MCLATLSFAEVALGFHWTALLEWFGLDFVTEEPHLLVFLDSP